MFVLTPFTLFMRSKVSLVTMPQEEGLYSRSKALELMRTPAPRLASVSASVAPSPNTLHLCAELLLERNPHTVFEPIAIPAPSRTRTNLDRLPDLS